MDVRRVFDVCENVSKPATGGLCSEDTASQYRKLHQVVLVVATEAPCG